MYKMLKDLKTETKLNNEGKEKMSITALSDFDATNPKVKMHAFVQLKPGEEVQYHMHVGESETYFILSGKGMYNDNGNKIEVAPGMVTLTPSGEGHAIKNTGDDILAFVALILFD